MVKDVDDAHDLFQETGQRTFAETPGAVYYVFARVFSVDDERVRAAFRNGGDEQSGMKAVRAELAAIANEPAGTVTVTGPFGSQAAAFAGLLKAKKGLHPDPTFHPKTGIPLVLKLDVTKAARWSLHDPHRKKLYATSMQQQDVPAVCEALTKGAPVFSVLCEEFASGGDEGKIVAVEVQAHVTVEDANAAAKAIAMQKRGGEGATIDKKTNAGGAVTYHVVRGDRSWKVRVLHQDAERSSDGEEVMAKNDG